MGTETGQKTGIPHELWETILRGAEVEFTVILLSWQHVGIGR